MSINLYFAQISPLQLDKIKQDESLLIKTIKNSYNDKPSSFNNLKGLYEGQGIFSTDDFVRKYPYVNQLDAELKKEALKRINQIFRKSSSKNKVLNLEKSWHTIHFLLSGEVWENNSLLGSVLMGGTEIGSEKSNTGYGIPRFHSPNEVKKIAESLPTLEELKNKFDPEKISEAGIYAFNADDAEFELQYLSEYYRKMFDYFQDAVKLENAILLFSV